MRLSSTRSTLAKYICTVRRRSVLILRFKQYASYYLERTYFFDIHPPFGKLLYALIGWFVGYDGNFHFKKIGDSYITDEVPYVAFRALPALLGALTVLVVFNIMWESGYTLPACILSACFVLFDNAHIIQTRLILLDATLVFTMSCSLLCYIKFHKLRHTPFGRQWWMWLLLTGFSLSCDISTKYVGLFAFITIGSAVTIDLWDLLKISRQQGALSLLDFIKHFTSRLFALIILPFLFYLFWFKVHFAILYRSGPGDRFMSPQFQETLIKNNPVTIHYYDAIQIKHNETDAYLHSHLDRYPFRYRDGRVSSQGQQVTGLLQRDKNNYWEIMPLVDDQLAGNVVRNNDTVRLRHLATNTMLLSHNVASPYYRTNQEFTTVPMDQLLDTRFNDTLFELRIENSNPGQEFQSLAGQFKLVHKPSNVAMWTHPKPLPDWAFHQQEISGNKNILLSSNIWFVDEIPSIPADSERLVNQERKPKSMPFFKKWFEVQSAMLTRNNALRRGHPSATKPFMWPFVSRGISFWTRADTRQQIFFLGNLIGWWIASSFLAVFAAIILADQLFLRRGANALDYRKY
jgi:dolichyl-phosphate-mannose-protein mannosyltransferase